MEFRRVLFRSARTRSRRTYPLLPRSKERLTLARWRRSTHLGQGLAPKGNTRREKHERGKIEAVKRVMREGDRHAHDRMVGKDHGLRNQVRAGSKQMQLSNPKYCRWRTPGRGHLMTLGRKAGNTKPSARRLFADGKRL